MSVYAPFRLLLAAAAALLIASVIASSSAHALLLGDAVVRSAPGAPLRVVIPLKPTPGEALDTACFRLVPTAAGEVPPVTAGVSLERAAATPRLIVTTQIGVADPVVRFAVEASCDGILRRNYAIVLDSRGTGAAPPVATTATTTAREPGQERLDTPIAVKVPVESARVAVASPEEAYAKTSAASRTPERVLASVATFARPPAEDSIPVAWYVGTPLAMGGVALGILFAMRRRTPALPDWTLGGEQSGPRSRTDMSAHPVTLSHDDFTPLPKLPTKPRHESASLGTIHASAAANSSIRKAATEDPSTLDTLINDVSEADRQEELAVRAAWAAARHQVEREEDNDILRAIDEAERELLFVPPSPKEAAIDRSLEDDLLSQPGRSDKAAA